MPRVSLRNRYQKVLLWRATGANDNYGQPVVGEPEEIRVRWNTGRSEALDNNGTKVSLDASLVVAERIPLGSLMWLAPLQGANTDTALAQWYGVGSGSAVPDTELMYVKTYNESRDIRNRISARTVGLMKYKNTVD
jgi:hypothetical protein